MNTELEVARKVKAMTRHEVILKAIEGRLTWTQAADIVRLSPRQVRRLKLRFERDGVHGLRDGRGKPRRGRIPADAVQQILQTISYTWVKFLLQEARLAERAPGRGKYRWHRERRPMRGMLLHLDASTHEWIPGVPPMDLNVVLDDADGRILVSVRRAPFPRLTAAARRSVDGDARNLGSAST